MGIDNRIRPRWPWVIGTVGTVMVIGLVILIVVLCYPPGEDEPAPTQPSTEPSKQPASDDIVCSRYSSFSGYYAEDGSDELVEDVAAMLVTNTSDQYLALATLTYLIDGQEATFVVTGLPPGSSAWVMEADRMKIGEDAVFRQQDIVSSFSEPADLGEEITLLSNDYDLIATNETGKTLKDVYVYYKVLHSDGYFFGGITYRVGFGDLEPGGSAQSVAGHYSVDGAEVVRVTWQEE